MTTHTPKPHIAKDKPESGLIWIEDQDGNTLAEVFPADIDWNQALANATLYAAAPELLEVCGMLTRCKPDDDPIVMFTVVQKALAAVAKATGGAELAPSALDRKILGDETAERGASVAP